MIFGFREMGFWEKSLKKYFDDERIILMTKRQVIRFNYENNINNTNNIADYNQYIIGQIIGTHGNRHYLETNAFVVTEKDMIDTSEREIFTLQGLIPVFMVYAIGITLSVIVFLMEILYNYLKK